MKIGLSNFIAKVDAPHLGLGTDFLNEGTRA